MQVIATAGHVDHGKSTLIRALTGIEPDRLAEEKRRGLTIDLGFAWTVLPSGQEVSFVDVPGHERFLGNMLTGLGPAPLVCFVVAADEGWQAQSSDHRDAVAALGIDQGLLVVTRADLAPDRVPEVIAQARAELAGTGLAHVPALAVSAVTGEGMDALRAHLDDLVAAARRPDAAERVRLWVDRSFTVAGAGTVVTGTLGAGTLHREDRLVLSGTHGGGERGGDGTEVQVRGLQSRGGQLPALGPVSRAAVNLRGVEAEQIGRGDALLTPGAWHLTAQIDVRRTTGADLADAPNELIAHVGTAAVTARVRPFGAHHARLTLERPLPLAVGDALVLRGSGSHGVRTGVRALDVDPPSLVRRGDGRRRQSVLEAMPEGGDLAGEVARRGTVPEQVLRRYGIAVPHQLPDGVERHGDQLVDVAALAAWREELTALVGRVQRADPLSAGVPRKAAADALALPAPELLDGVVAAAGLALVDGRVRDPAAAAGLGAAEAGVAQLEKALTEAPFRAPEAEDLTALGLGARELAAAAAQGRLLRLPDEVVLLPTAPALAMRQLARLAQPFTTSGARQALGTTRRVAIPLLEHLDARGWTRRVDARHRQVVR
ncbi:selenocysteine-specific translation elongation factor [Brachybacterium saurashtrense]|uniref:Selenocysteine-specific translation elongation factor n=1 Tax=Brachybacterium saurashtrense TaxID=556288 RepID=A0A345YKS8_9MICO|nr:SelB C-terminal domain-containing protein [Brachybacterium saurashtrense]AXK44530.1 selenocysteine-specific translation elongation factor [Brachybacterium saurashtrense]RRR23142.1 selenocysteine-specific translation elongation factor [Brachybacterium saurashtrense]